MKHLTITGAVAALLCLATACGGGRRPDAPDHDAVEAANNELTEAMTRGDSHKASQLADSMALYVDDLTPDETVTVLLAFLQRHNDSDGRDLETQRKYVDVYDIAMANDREGMDRALDRARRLNPEADFRAAAADFRANLAEYDALRTYGKPEEEPADSTVAKTDSVPTPLSD